MKRADTCPRCHGQLVLTDSHGFETASCLPCRGVAVERINLVWLLEEVARAVFKEIDPDFPLEPLRDLGGDIACPACARTMEHFCYMGSRLVEIDACDPCGLIWFDDGELVQAAALLARTDRRRFAAEAERAKDRRTYADGEAAVREAWAIARQFLLPDSRRRPDLFL